MSAAIPIPREASQALEVLRRCLADGLLAVYLHGSAVAGGLRPHSDVDILAIVERPLTVAQRRAMVGQLMRISAYPAREGGPRPVEVIVFRLADLRRGAYPPRAELIYGEWRRAFFEAGGIPDAENDPELVPMLAWARQAGVALQGPPTVDLLPVVPMDTLRRAMGDALPALMASLEGDERNGLLTLARMWHTSSTGAIVPKDVAAQWAMGRVPAGMAREIGLAREDYLGLASRAFEWNLRKSAVRQTAHSLGERIERLLN